MRWKKIKSPATPARQLITLTKVDTLTKNIEMMSNQHSRAEQLYSRVASEEYDPFYGRYIEHSRGRNFLTRLKQSKADFLAMAATLNDKTARHRYAADKWSVKEIIGHVTDTERIMAFRALSFARGERAKLPGYDHDAYVQAANFDSLPLDTLLANYISVRKSSLKMFESFTPEMILQTGIASGCRFSVRALGFIIAGHDMHHRQVIRKRYLPGMR